MLDGLRRHCEILASQMLSTETAVQTYSLAKVRGSNVHSNVHPGQRSVSSLALLRIVSCIVVMFTLLRLYILDLHLTLSLPRVIHFKFPLEPHQYYYITQYEELGSS